MRKQPTDWHPAIIVAHLRIAGTSLRKLAKEHEMYPTAFSVALQRPWLKAEGIIANAIGVAPETIWPTRYKKRKDKRLRREKNDAGASVRQCSHDCNVKTQGGA